MNEIELTKEEIALIEGYNQQLQTVNAELQGALKMILVSQKIGGNWNEWRYDGGKLVRGNGQAGPQPVPSLQPLKTAKLPGDDLAAQALQTRDQTQDIRKALKFATEAIRLGVSGPLAYMVAASCLGFNDNCEEAVSLLDDALAQFPHEVDNIRHERAFQHLRLKNWEQGWEDWEYRNTRKQLIKTMGEVAMAASGSLLPEWDGEAEITGKLLVIGEGGIGDGIMYLRWLPLLKSKFGIEVLFVCKNQSLKGLAKHVDGVWEAVCEQDAVPCACSHWISLYSLPRLVQPTPPPPIELPVEWTPGMKVAKAGLAWHGDHRSFRAGLAWHGDPTAVAFRWRPTNIKDWHPIFHTGMDCYSLELNDTPEEFGGKDCGHPDSLLDFAKFICGLDVVVTADCMVAHLCGCLGIPTYMVIHKYGYWPWEANSGEASNWYPNIRVIKMLPGENWTGVFRRVATELKQVLIRNDDAPVSVIAG